MVSTPTTATPYELLKECFEDLKTCKPEDRKPIIQGYARIFELREQLTQRRAIDDCMKRARLAKATPAVIDALAEAYGLAKAGVQK